MILSNGEIVEIGETEEIFYSPQSDYTRQLIKASTLEIDDLKISP